MTRFRPEDRSSKLPHGRRYMRRRMRVAFMGLSITTRAVHRGAIGSNPMDGGDRYRLGQSKASQDKAQPNTDIAGN